MAEIIIEEEKLSIPRRIRRWIAKHRKEVELAILVIAFLLLAGWYLFLLIQLLSVLATVNPFLFWAVIGTNLGAVAWLITLFVHEPLVVVPTP